jgi:hypothetical protein
MAVEVNTKPTPETNENATGNPVATPTAVEQHRAGRDLNHTQPADLFAQRPQPRRAHLQADDEEEHDDAELGDLQERLRMGDDAQSIGTDPDPGGEIAEHGAESEPLEKRRRDDCRRKERDDRQQVDTLMFGSHEPIAASFPSLRIVLPRT